MESEEGGICGFGRKPKFFFIFSTVPAGSGIRIPRFVYDPRIHSGNRPLGPHPPMTLKYQNLTVVPDDLGENDVRICSSQFSDIAGCPASDNRLYPWKSRIVAVTTQAGTVYRLLKGHGSLPIPSGICWIGPRTRTQLDVQEDATIAIVIVRPQWLGRVLFYNNHLDDTVRFTFRLGVWGLIFAVLSLALSVQALLKS